MDITELDSAALMFVGVNAGYDGEAMGLREAHQAANIAKSIVAAGKRLLSDSNDYEVLPAVAVYPPTWGCMIGGEPVAAIITNDDCKNAEKMARHLQARLKQQELTLAMFVERKMGKPTLNFHALLDSSLKEFGSAWQVIAGDYYERRGIYVSVGAYERSGGVVISSQANPDFRIDLQDWKFAAEEVCYLVGRDMGKRILPVFSEVRYIYLDEKDLQRSADKTPAR